ncbi:MAG TPA: hypothetical protein GXZ48_06210 [Acholeplasmataceae bacterium]|nr:hypothetical protein [Acholeplasmataceae bacterium]
MNKEPKKIDSNGNEFEFADNLFDAKGKVGDYPITGGLITRELIRKAEEMLANDKKPK